jgi:hypothetical protein
MSTDKKLLEEKTSSLKESVPLNVDSIEDFSPYKEGVIFEPLNKLIKILMVNNGDYIVFLDEELYVHRYYNSRYETSGLAKDYSEVVIRQSNLESISKLLLKESQLEVFRRLLGESIARLLQDRNSKSASVMLDKAEVFLTERSRERARMWYLSASVVATAIMIVGGLFLWANRQVVAVGLKLGDSAIDVMVGAAAGSLGALISILQRSDELETDVSAGPSVHYFEGAVRILIGVTAGLIFALAIKSNILLGAVNKSEQALTILLVISIIAGASERLLPNLIKQIEGTLITNLQEVQVISKDGSGQEKNAPEQVALGGTKKKRKGIFFRRKQ